jgi:hypothetical protein
MTFLLKPNHALGFVLLPPLLLAFARIRSWRGRVAVGLLLHVLGWVFVIHMAFVAAGLGLFVAWSFFTRHEERRKDALDAAVVFAVNILIVSPYLVMLFVGYPFLYASPRAMIPPFSPHLLEATLKQGPIFWLGLWGTLVAMRRGDRLGRVFAAQVAAGYFIWASVLVLSVLQLARERDEIYYWIRLLTAAAAGIGAWDLANRVAAWLRLDALPAPTRCAAVLALALPWSLPYWWDPLVMDSYVPGSLQPIPDRLRVPTDFIRRRTDPKAIFAGDRDYARYVAALGGRRVSLADSFHAAPSARERDELEQELVFDGEGSRALARAHELDVSYFVVTPRLLAFHADRARMPSDVRPPRAVPRLAEIEARSYLERALLWRGPGQDFVAIYRIRGAGR